ncbi:hypothetical protein CHH28_07220 [Bacterioplanes sanyensis]|uniref:Uncharacterized protein n=1 Tax=Bacterioplanes sanyensis TaxID=1249553 RepID=A0A222FHE2_9GAMM|nr:ACT domain-containing protein [Bacterioplanes sanyensis]ASP38475.1 hypothetical protein CHH28_07220 [Bacterioplanes sanyensis]
MSGLTNLQQMLEQMEPELMPEEWAFCSVPGPLSAYIELEPLASMQEKEGLSLIVPQAKASHPLLADVEVLGPYRQITLNVHSSLEAVGLTAAFAQALTQHGISANVVAGFYHDHIFVTVDKAESALIALKALSDDAR